MKIQTYSMYNVFRVKSYLIILKKLFRNRYHTKDFKLHHGPKVDSIEYSIPMHYIFEK